MGTTATESPNIHRSDGQALSEILKFVLYR
jgi:hypothetical protein